MIDSIERRKVMGHSTSVSKSGPVRVTFRYTQCSKAHYVNPSGTGSIGGAVEYWRGLGPDRLE